MLTAASALVAASGRCPQWPGMLGPGICVPLHVPTLDYSHQRNHPAICSGCLLFVQRQASITRPVYAEQHMTLMRERRHQMVLIIRKSGHIRAVTRCHEDVTTLSCGH